MYRLSNIIIVLLVFFIIFFMGCTIRHASYDTERNKTNSWNIDFLKDLGRALEEKAIDTTNSIDLNPIVSLLGVGGLGASLLLNRNRKKYKEKLKNYENKGNDKK